MTQVYSVSNMFYLFTQNENFENVQNMSIYKNLFNQNEKIENVQNISIYKIWYLEDYRKTWRTASVV
jgi:hypothetical protein